jgi:Ca2+-binding EF-hand superfamily protein
LASDEEKKKLTETFKALDVNGDGTLSKEEIKNGYKKNNKAITNEELEFLVATVDSNKNNAINYKEFMVASLNRRELLTDARIDSCFKLFDRVSVKIQN